MTEKLKPTCSLASIKARFSAAENLSATITALKQAAALGFDPANCVVFEDSLSGVEAGKAAGAKVVGVATTHTREELSNTDYVIDDFNNLDPLALIQTLFPSR